MDVSRLFIGFMLNKDWTNAIIQFIDAQHTSSIKWIPESNWHITVLFIGDFPNQHIAEFKTYLSSFFSSKKTFGIPFDTFVYAPNTKRPRMIWAKGAINKNFTGICEDTSTMVSSFCEQHSIDFKPIERVEIIPHVTLLRFPPTFHMPPLRIVDVNAFPLPMIINQLHLFESKTTSAGAVYTILQSFQLGK